MGLNKLVAGKGFKNFMAKLYGWGAAIVILGALFKINHYPGAEEMLIVGLSTEALIFFFSAFEKPHTDPDWSLVYPELGGIPGIKTDKRTSGGTSSTQQLDKMLDDANIGSDLIESLGEGLKKFSAQTKTMNEVADASIATNGYIKNIGGASAALNNLSEGYKKTSENLNKDLDISNDYLANVKRASTAAGSLADTYQNTSKAVKSDSDVYNNVIGKVAENLNALNSVYELQLKEASKQKDSSAKMEKNIEGFIQNLDASVKATQQYQKEVSVLAEKVSALNNVYGNMLSAMNVSRNSN
ncbi:MAG: gliding motility protein GldL [Bacteroidota bacterium]|nr:gliding motility protein GldL [Bacteroidota bacterium]